MPGFLSFLLDRQTLLFVAGLFWTWECFQNLVFPLRSALLGFKPWCWRLRLLAICHFYGLSSFFDCTTYYHLHFNLRYHLRITLLGCNPFDFENSTSGATATLSSLQFQDSNHFLSELFILVSNYFSFAGVSRFWANNWLEFFWLVTV